VIEDQGTQLKVMNRIRRFWLPGTGLSPRYFGGAMEDQGRLSRLTPREREIYRLRTESYSKRMIANELHITFHQVEEHLEAMRAKLGDDPYLPRNPPLDRLGLWDMSMGEPEPLNRLTPRERDVYHVSRNHKDWSNAQIGREVLLPPHVVRRYLQNIKRKLEAPDWPPSSED
jgi:DNA-binding CsgD family transcriptional regulator